MFVFGVPHKGSFLTLTGGAAVYHHCHRNGAADLHLYEKPDCRHFRNGDYHVDPGDTVFRDDRSGSFAGRAGRWIGEVYPTSHFLTIARGTFSKALDLTDLWQLLSVADSHPAGDGLKYPAAEKQEG